MSLQKEWSCTSQHDVTTTLCMGAHTSGEDPCLLSVSSIRADLRMLFKETFPLMVRAMLQHRLLSICKHLS